MPYTVGLTASAIKDAKNIPTDEASLQKYKAYAEAEFFPPDEVSRQSLALMERLSDGFGLERVLPALSEREFTDLQRRIGEPSESEAQRIDDLGDLPPIRPGALDHPLPSHLVIAGCRNNELSRYLM